MQAPIQWLIVNNYTWLATNQLLCSWKSLYSYMTVWTHACTLEVLIKFNEILKYVANCWKRITLIQVQEEYIPMYNGYSHSRSRHIFMTHGTRCYLKIFHCIPNGVCGQVIKEDILEGNFIQMVPSHAVQTIITIQANWYSG